MLIGSLFRTLNKLSYALFALALTGLILPSSYASADDAASLKVSVKQVNPDGVAQEVTCAAMQKGCSLPLVINAGTAVQQSLNILVAYVSGKAVLTFQSGAKYFYTRDTTAVKDIYNPLWIKRVSGNAATYKITLFQPLTQRLVDSKAISNIVHTPVADLEVTATPGP